MHKGKIKPETAFTTFIVRAKIVLDISLAKNVIFEPHPAN